MFKAISNVNNDATLVPFIYSVLGYGASDRPLHIVLGYFLAISGVLIKKKKHFPLRATSILSNFSSKWRLFAKAKEHSIRFAVTV